MSELRDRLAQRPWSNIALGGALAFAITFLGSYSWTKNWGDSLVFGIGMMVGIVGHNVAQKIWLLSKRSQS